MTNNLGLYLHIPFCEKKCKYCDFYSSFSSEELLENYTFALTQEIKKWGGLINRPIDTIYLGGGTPSLLSHRLKNVTDAVKESFNVLEDCEITLELNPKGDTEKLLKYAKECGVNRLSIGAQSGNNQELSVLGRLHTAEDTIRTVETARKLGFSNISLDIMIGLPDSNLETLHENLEFITSLRPEHISAYILKIEENTAFYSQKKTLNLPDDEQVAQQYLFMCEYLEKKGYSHYEISNFAKKGFESQHNLKYWKGYDYLGLGPSAHSAVDGKRFYFERDLKSFLKGATPLPDGDCGSKEEFVMLSLRLKTGLCFDEYKSRFNKNLPDDFFKKAEFLESHGLLTKTQKNLYLTDKGMLLSNSIITELLECI